MAVVLKPRSNAQGVVEFASDLALLNGRPGYQVLVKDLGVFEWVATGVVDNDNIYLGLNGKWSKVLESNESVNLAYTPEDINNKSSSIALDGTSDVKYPTTKAVKIYADSLILGLLNDRGSFSPGGSSPGAWPTTGGSGVGGAIMKGDIWFCSGSGFMGTTSVVAGASFRALVDSPGQTAANWNVLSAGAISITSPTLQQVTTAGAITNVSMAVISNLAFGGVSTYSTGGNGGAEIGYETTLKGYISIDNGTRTGYVSANNLTNTRYIELPDANGTLALTSQIGEPYKVYTASFNLTTSGSGIDSIVVHRNTIGDGSADGVNDIQLTYFGLGGIYNATMTNGTAFPSGKTWIQSTNYIAGSEAFNFYGRRVSNSVVRYSSIKTSNNSTTPGSGITVFIEIRVYP